VHLSASHRRTYRLRSDAGVEDDAHT
jgi:hypothetical protein